MMEELIKVLKSTYDRDAAMLADAISGKGLSDTQMCLAVHEVVGVVSKNLIKQGVPADGVDIVMTYISHRSLEIARQLGCASVGTC